MKTCLVCGGSKVAVGIACGPSAPGRFEVPCPPCKGTGQVSDEHFAARLRQQATSDARRADRLARNLGLREAAKERGVGVLEYSRWERATEIEIPD